MFQKSVSLGNTHPKFMRKLTVENITVNVPFPFGILFYLLEVWEFLNCK